MTEAYPLQWPEYRPRTKRRERARFDTTQDVAQLSLRDEVRRLGGKGLVISTNLELRLDGLPYASRRAPDDPGVAAYFEYKGRAVCFACDRWDLIKDNMQGIRKTIDALRGIARWGTGDMVEAAFTGFEALPPPGRSKPWRDVLGNCKTLAEAKSRRNELAKQHHGDTGAEGSFMADVNAAHDQAKKELS